MKFETFVHYGPEYVLNVFSCSLKKTCHQRKLRQSTFKYFVSVFLKVFTFQFLNDKIEQNTNFAKSQGKTAFLYNCKFSSFKNWSFAQLLSYFLGQFLWGEKIWEHWEEI